jgi:hypothetical protein
MTRRSILPMMLTLAALTLPASATAALEEPVTKKAEGVTAIEATLHGELNPNASGTAGYKFRWNSGSGCEFANETETQPEATGEKLSVEAQLSGLIPHQEYAFCLVATHQEGEAFEELQGPVQTFKTEALAPTVDTENEPTATPFSAVVEQQVNPQNEPTTCKIEWGKATASENEIACEPETLEGFGDQTVSRHLAGLEPGTIYKCKLILENAAGGGEGPCRFTTPALQAPLVDGESADAVTTSNARLEAQVNPNYQEATYKFEYATNEALTGATTVEPPEGTEPFPAGFEDHLASVELKGALAPGVTYYYRVVVTNATGSTNGTVQSFTTIGPPLVQVTGSASLVGRTSAQLGGGSIDTVGAATTVYYRYIDQAGYEAGLAEDSQDPYANCGTSLPLAHMQAAFEAKPAPVVGIEELAPATIYHFALIAENEAGTTIGPDETLTTSAPQPPAASTGTASAITQTSASVTGTVDPRGLDTNWELQLSSVPGIWTTLDAGAVEGAAEVTGLTFSLSFLAPGTTYRYRLLASNADGTVSGGEASFTTPGFPSPAGLPDPPQGAPFTPLAILVAGEGKGSSAQSTSALTRAQKLARALRACKRKPKSKRAACKRQARKRSRSH